MQPKQIIVVLIIFFSLVLLAVGGIGGWLYFQSMKGPTDNTGVTTDTTPIPGDTTQTTPRTDSSQSQGTDPKAEYNKLISSFSAKTVQFTTISTSTKGTYSGIYKLYADDVAIAKEFKPTPASFPIQAASADLDGDGAVEIIVYEDMPFMCGSGGCNIDVYKKEGSGWKKILEALGYEAIAISTMKTGGYANLLLSVHGETGSETTIKQYVWDGSKYAEEKVVGTWNGSTYVTTP